MEIPRRSLPRCPVKFMGDEVVETVTFDFWGIVGDRLFTFTAEDSHFAPSKDTRRFRRHDKVFEYSAVTAADVNRLVHISNATDGGCGHPMSPSRTKREADM